MNNLPMTKGHAFFNSTPGPTAHRRTVTSLPNSGLSASCIYSDCGPTPTRQKRKHSSDIAITGPSASQRNLKTQKTESKYGHPSRVTKIYYKSGELKMEKHHDRKNGNLVLYYQSGQCLFEGSLSFKFFQKSNFKLFKIIRIPKIFRVLARVFNSRGRLLVLPQRAALLLRDFQPSRLPRGRKMHPALPDRPEEIRWKN
jgi:hypothetical protein